MAAATEACGLSLLPLELCPGIPTVHCGGITSWVSTGRCTTALGKWHRDSKQTLFGEPTGLCSVCAGSIGKSLGSSRWRDVLKAGDGPLPWLTKGFEWVCSAALQPVMSHDDASINFGAAIGCGRL